MILPSLIGFNHQKTTLEDRERLAIPSDELTEKLTSLYEQSNTIEEVFILSTCNRFEIYYFSHENESEIILKWLSDYSGLSTTHLLTQSYITKDLETFLHLAKVSSGIDSQNLGENQILSQVKQAFSIAENTFDKLKYIPLLKQVILELAKKIRHTTDIGKNSLSPGQITYELAKKIFEYPHQKSILLIGAGQMIEAILSYFNYHEMNKVCILNRTLSNANNLATSFKNIPITTGSLSDLPLKCKEADIIISCIETNTPIISETLIQSSLKQSKKNNLFLLDLGLPRNIEESVHQIPNTYLYTLSDLDTLIQKNENQRHIAAQSAIPLLHQGLLNYQQKIAIQQTSEFLTNFQKEANTLKSQLQQKSKYKALYNHSPELFDEFSDQLTKQLLHLPLIHFNHILKNISSNSYNPQDI